MIPIATVRVVSEKSLEFRANEQLRADVRKILKDQFKGNKAECSKAIGISASMLSEFIKGTRGAGTKTLKKLAIFTGRSMSNLSGLTTTLDPGENRAYPVSALGNRPEWPALKEQFLSQTRRKVNPHLLEEMAHTQFSNAPAPGEFTYEAFLRAYDFAIELYGEDYEGPGAEKAKAGK